MPKVVNDIVKMEWEKKYWIESKSQGYFYFGGHMYKSSKYGEMMVGFNHACAFIMTFNTDGLDGINDGTDIYAFENYKLELKALSAEERFYVFSTDFDNTILLSKPDTDELKIEVIQKLGLEDYIDDIQNRLYDVLQYNEDYTPSDRKDSISEQKPQEKTEISTLPENTSGDHEYQQLKELIEGLRKECAEKDERINRLEKEISEMKSNISQALKLLNQSI